jgi:predicted phosphodiesterase
LRRAIISDIHSNREALDAVLAAIEKQKVDAITCLGDVVGYGADPNYCVEVTREHCEIVLMGNHDHAALGLTPLDYFNQYAKAAARWTSSQLNSKNKAYLQNLGYSYRQDKLLFVHSTPYEPERWDYIFTLWEAQWHFNQFSEQVCFLGHTHVPASFQQRNGDRRIINVGSVGQPRDDDPRACYFIYEGEDGKGEWVRVEYDVEKAAEKIIKAGLPKMLAERLFWGR